MNLSNINPKVFLFLTIIFLAPILIWLFFGNLISKKAPPTISPTPPQSQTTPTPDTSLPPTGVPVEKVLKIIKSSPPESDNITYSPLQPIEISFNNGVDASKVIYKTTPATEIVVKNGTYANKIFIYPKTTWKDGITTIAIEPGTLAVDGSLLYASYQYTITTLTPTDPPLQE